MNRTILIALVLAAGAGAGNAEARQAAQGPSPAVVAACVEAQQYIGVLADRASARLETARQSNSPPELRAAVADLQAVLVEIRTRAAACAPLQAAAAPDPHTGHALGTPQQSTAQPPQATAVDPVCSMTVDPKTAPKADYQGKTYYFCSESDRALFLKDPARYIK